MDKWKQLCIICFFMGGGGGVQTTQVKTAIAKARHSTDICRTTHKVLYKIYFKKKIIIT